MHEIVYSRGVALAFSFMILMNAYLFRRITGAWTTPPVVISLAWFFYTVIPAAVFFSVPINSLSILYIFACVLVFSLPALFLPWRPSPKIFNVKRLQNGAFWDRPTVSVYVALVFISIALIVPHLALQGIAVDDFFSNLHGTSGRYIAMKYAGSIEIGLNFRLSVLCNYVAVLLGGLIFATAPSMFKKLTIIISVFLPSLLFMVLYGDKGTLFLCIAFFLGSFVSVSIINGEPRLLSWKAVRTVLMAMPVLIPTLVSSFLARGMKTDDLELLTHKLSYAFASYSLGHMYAFSDWFTASSGLEAAQSYFQTITPKGFLTFKSMMSLAGAEAIVPDGFYEEYLKYPGQFQSNIYTIFRGLIQDFGIWVSMSFWLGAGLLWSISYILMTKLKTPEVMIAPYALLFGFIYSSFIISLFVWTSPIVSALVFALGLVIRPAILTFFDVSKRT